jgi:acetyl esterase
MPLDPEISEFLAAFDDAPDIAELPIPELRAALNGMTRYSATPPETALVADHVARTAEGTIPLRLFHPQPGTTLPLLLYFPGGGWVAGSIEHADRWCRWLAAGAGAAVLSVDYRRAPEHRFPAAHRDAYAVTGWAQAHAADLGADPLRLLVSGESAGGNLAAAVALRARTEGPHLLGQVLICPVTDADFDTASYRHCATGYLNTAAAMRWFWETYLGRRLDSGVDVPLETTPLRVADPSGLPPTVVVTMEYDPLRTEGEAYAQRLAAAGVAVTLITLWGCVHCVLYLDGIANRAAAAREQVISAVRELSQQVVPDSGWACG